MNRSRPFLAPSFFLFLLAAACGEAPKVPVVKTFTRAESTKGTKGVAGDAARHAALNTGVLNSAGLSKGVYKITLGETVEGLLGRDETTTEEGKNQDLWILELERPADVEITMVSDDVDAYLDIDEVVGFEGGVPQTEHLGENDDMEDATDAGLAGSLGAGTFVIFATTYEAGESGSYTLSVTPSGASSPGAGEARAFSATIEPNTTYNGTLTDNDAVLEEDGTHYHLIRFRGRAGDEVTATLSSADFDAYLLFGLGAGSWSDLDLIGQNDDADGSTLNSRIVVTLPEDGIYTFVVNTVGPATGSYALTVNAAAPDYSRFSAGPSDPAGKYALVVGINDYPGSGSDLSGPTNDADLVAQALVEGHGFDPQNVIVLEDGEATRPNIANAIVRHLGKAGPDGVAVFFYSGHGTRIGENIGFLDDEADGQDDGLYLYGYGQESSVLLDEELGYLFSQLKGNTLVAVDACYSGTISRAPGAQAKRADMTDPDVQRNIRLPKTFITGDLGTGYAFGSGAPELADLFSKPGKDIVMSSSSEEQVSWTNDSWPEGSGPASLFAYYFAKELRAADSSLTFRGLMQRVDAQVDAIVRDSGGKFEEQDAQLVGPGLDRSVRAFLKSN